MTAKHDDQFSKNQEDPGSVVLGALMVSGFAAYLVLGVYGLWCLVTH